MKLTEHLLSFILSGLCWVGAFFTGKWLWFEYYTKTYAQITPWLEVQAWLAGVFLVAFIIGGIVFGLSIKD